jgi:hypothetical protein
LLRDCLSCRPGSWAAASALAAGWPIATGILEGACRHLIGDRLDITGARWGLEYAEAILTLRAVIANGDFDYYWRYHLAKEHQWPPTPTAPARSRAPTAKSSAATARRPAPGNQPSMDDRLTGLPGAPAFVTLIRLGICHVLWRQAAHRA